MRVGAAFGVTGSNPHIVQLPYFPTRTVVNFLHQHRIDANEQIANGLRRYRFPALGGFVDDGAGQVPIRQGDAVVCISMFQCF